MFLLRRVPPGLVEVVLSYCHCCLVDRTLLELLPYLADKSVGVINASILSMGLLTKQVRLLSPSPSPSPSPNPPHPALVEPRCSPTRCVLGRPARKLDTAICAAGWEEPALGLTCESLLLSVACHVASCLSCH